MTRRIFCKVLLVVVAIFGLLVLSGVLSAQGRSEEALEHVKDVQERNTNWLMAMEGVEGTAIGYNQNDRLAIKVFTAGPGVRGIPQEIDGVQVQVVVTGKFYALPKPPSPPGQDKKNPPPKAPTGLTATTASETQINLVWNKNIEDDLDHYNVYRSGYAGGPYSEIGSAPKADAPTYSDTELAAGTTYYYVVTAVDTGGKESDNSDEAFATTDGEPEPPPPPDKPPLWCERPVPIGVSTGHPDITAGTIGCRVIDASGNVYALSNNHVYANENKASIGDNVLQPGTYDGGVDPDDAIGTLADFEPINFHPRASNTIDAAIALTSTDMVGNATPSDGYGTPSSTTATAYVGLEVQKYGRNGQTFGEVDSVNATVRVYYSTRFAIFVNQVVITPGDFSAGGDSGSLIVTDDEACNPVGLLFAGSSSYTIANQIDEVLGAFGVSIDDSTE